MAAQIRPNRLEVTDRFPMLGFTIRTDGSPQRAEVAIATDPSLFRPDRKAARTLSNFYSSRAAGPLMVPHGEAVYVVPPEVLARFIGQERLYVGLATTPGNNGAPPRVDVTPTEGSPYILLKSLTGRSMRRVRMVPTRQGRAAGYGGNGAALEWAGDAATPGAVMVPGPGANGNGHGSETTTAPPAAIGYDDGFGPMAAPTSPGSAAPRAGGNGTATTVTPGTAGNDVRSTGLMAQALDLSSLSVLAERLPVGAPAVTRLPQWQAAAAQGALTALAGPLAPIVTALPMAATAAGVSIGVGPAVGAGLGAGAGLGVGIVFGPDGGVGVYGAAEFQVGFLASISATAQITIVRGGIESFNGWGMAAAISGGEGIVGGAAALFDMNGNFQGVSFQLGVGGGLTPIDFYVAIQRQVATQLAVAQARMTQNAVGRLVPSARYGARGLSGEIPLDPGNGGMSIGLDALEVGDIIVSTSGAIISDLIRFGTGSPVSHAMLFVGQGGQVVDATGDGVRLRPLADALSDATLAVAFRYPGLTDDQRMIIADKVAEYIGSPYNYWGIVRQAQFQVHRAVCDVLPESAASVCRNFYGRIDLGRGNNSEFFCSELLVKAYQEAGVPITQTPPIWSNPDDLVQLAIPQGALVYVGHLKAPPYERRQSIWESLGLSLAAAPTGVPSAFGPMSSGARLAARPRAAAFGTVRLLDAERRRVSFPPARPLSAVEKTVALGALAIVSPGLSGLIMSLRAAANQFNISIGLGPAASVSFWTQGAGIGGGIIFAPNNQIGVYGQIEIKEGFLIAGESLELQCTVVNGGIEAFGGINYAGGAEVEWGLAVGVQLLFDEAMQFQGVTVSVGEGAGNPVQVYWAASRAISAQLAAGQALTGRPGSTSVAARRGAGAFGVARALDSAHRPAHFPEVRTLGPIEREVALGALSLLSPGLSALVLGLRAVANHHNVSIGVGPAVSAGFLTGAGVGVGLIFAPGDEVGAYGQFDIRAGLIDSASAELQCTIVSGGLDTFSGISLALAVEVDAGVSVSAQALFNTSLQFQGVTFGLGVGLGVEPIQVFLSLQGSAAVQLAAAQSVVRSRPLTSESFTLNWDEVEAIPQPTDVSCWAAAAAMVVGWKDRVSLPPDAVAGISGRTTATGLDPQQIQQFANEMGLVFEYPASYSVDGFRRLLESNGPLWVAASVPGLHAIVVTGMYSDGTNVYVRITDPWDRAAGTPGTPGAYLTTHATGSRYILKWDDFVREYESAATDFSNVNLQILHPGGAVGRTANYGGTTPPGYAQALRAARAMVRRPASHAYARAHGDGATTTGPVSPSMPARRIESGGRGSARWTLEQYDGLRRLPNMAPAAANTVVSDRVVRLDDWPLVHLPEGDVQLPLDVAWRYNSGAVGDVAIRAADPRMVPGWTLAVSAEIVDGPDTLTTAALSVRIRHVFGRSGRPDIIGLSELTLFGDGTYARQDRWEQAEASVA